MGKNGKRWSAWVLTLCMIWTSVLPALAEGTCDHGTKVYEEEEQITYAISDEAPETHHDVIYETWAYDRCVDCGTRFSGHPVDSKGHTQQEAHSFVDGVCEKCQYAQDQSALLSEVPEITAPIIQVTDVEIEPHRCIVHGEIISDGNAEILDYGFYTGRGDPKDFTLFSLGVGKEGEFQYIVERERCGERIKCGVYAKNEAGDTYDAIYIYTPCCHQHNTQENEELVDATYTDLDSNFYHQVANEVWAQQILCGNLGHNYEASWKKDSGGFDDSLEGGICGEVLEEEYEYLNNTVMEYHSYYYDIFFSGEIPEEGVYECDECGHTVDFGAFKNSCTHESMRTVGTDWEDAEYINDGNALSHQTTWHCKGSLQYCLIMWL